MEERPKGLTDLVSGSKKKGRMKGGFEVFEMSHWVHGGAIY